MPTVKLEGIIKVNLIFYFLDKNKTKKTITNQLDTCFVIDLLYKKELTNLIRQKT